MRILRDQNAINAMLRSGVNKVQRDNLRRHYVNEVTQLFDLHLIELIDFLSYSPDLAPIENMYGDSQSSSSC